MNFIYVLIIFLALLILCEIVAILLKITGLDMDKARFQVISIITHTGFTTRESELIAQHPIRRKLVSYLMLFSYVGQATFFSILISVIRDNSYINLLIIVTAIILLILLVLTSSSVLVKFEPLLDRFFSSRLKKSITNKCIERVLYINDEYEVIEVIVKSDNPLCNIYLKDFSLDYIKVLLIDKGHHVIATPKGSDFIEEGDRIVAYGKAEMLEKILINN